MKIVRWSNLLLAVVAAWALGCGSVHADSQELEDAVVASALAHSPAEPAGEASEHGVSPTRDGVVHAPAGEAADQGGEAERARGEQVAKTIGKVVLFILLVPLAILSGGGSIGSR